MHISFSPVRHNDSLHIERYGDQLMLNGDLLDLSFITEGATLPRSAIVSPWVSGDITRTDGQLHVPLWLPHGAQAPAETMFPAPITVDTDGPVALPAYEDSSNG